MAVALRRSLSGRSLSRSQDPPSIPGVVPEAPAWSKSERSERSDRAESKKTRFTEEEPEEIDTSEGEVPEESDSSSSSPGLQLRGPEPPTSKPMSMPSEDSATNPLSLMKLGLIQEYKARFLEKVKENRREVTLPAATGILREVPFFREFDDVLSGTIFHLSKLSLLQDAEEGEVLFRQGDDPVDCYVVMRGAVEVWIRKDAQTSPRDFTEDDVVVTQEQKRRGCRCFRRKKDEAVMELNDSERKYVTEGFNTFGASSDLGTMVAVLKRGTAFGELGLMERKPRAASIRCAQKCTFLVIRRSAFHKWFSESMGADAYRKRIFFIRKIPGFRYETLRNPMRTGSSLSSPTDKRKGPTHPVDAFKEVEVKGGQVLLWEGQMEAPVVYIVRSGALEVSRLSRPGGGTRLLPQRQRAVPFARLRQDEIYCSLTTLGFDYPEQFSLSAPKGEACSIWVAKEEDLAQLPERVLRPLRAHLHNALRPLLCYSGAYLCTDQLVIEDEKKLPDDESDED